MCQAAVLVAIAIPIFTTQLEKSREATDLANIRSAYAEQMVAYLDSDGSTTIADINVPVKQRQDKWQSVSGEPATTTVSEGTSAGGVSVPAKTSGSYVVKISSSGVVTVE